MKSLLLFSIGPVQDFIAASRRMRDLSNGSHMLSFLASRAVRELRHEIGNQNLIFPHVSPGDLSYLSRHGSAEDVMKQEMKIAAMPNRILAVVDSDKVTEYAGRMEEVVRGELLSISDYMLNKAPDAFSTVDVESWRSAISNALEITWASSPVSESDLKSSATYFEAYKKVDRLLGMRKTLRDFKALAGTGYVCSLAPNLSAVKPLDTSNLFPSANRKFTEKLNRALNHVFSGAFNDDNERLSPLSYLKRIYNVYLKEVYDLRLSGLDSPEEIAGKMPDGVKSRKYYGILLMDGDRMGVRLTEPTSSDMNVGVDYHRGVSKSLHHFATTRVPELVGKFHGQLMYAGGDDVLALFPTDEIVGCADEIRKEFSKELALATMSAGITVVHISHPLREALDDARYAEKTAKNDLGRDAVSFRIVKRSGQILVSGGKWATNGMRLVEDFLTPMLSHVRLGKERTRKGISYKWVQDISHLSFVSPALPPDATLAELHRLFKRHAQDSSKDVWATTLQPWLQTQLPGHLDDAATMIDTAFYLGRGTDQ